MNNKKTDISAPILWGSITVLWIVLLIMDFKSGFPSPFITGLRIVCLISSFMAAVSNYRKYKNGR